MKCFNCSLYINQTFEIKQIPVSLPIVLEGIIGLSILWICCAYVIYIAWNIIKYLNQKAPNLQTMLDGFHVQYFAFVIGFTGMLMILQLLIELNVVLSVEYQIVTEVVGWIFYSFYLFSSLSLATSCIARTLSIFWHSEIEAISDKKCWFFNG